MTAKRDKRTFGPSCPKCGNLAGVSRLFWGLGKPFDCRSCGTRLLVPRGRNIFVGIAGILAYWRADRVYDGWQIVLVFLIICYAIVVVSLFTMRPELVSPGSPD